MSYHLALAICKVPTMLGPGEVEEIRYRAGRLQLDYPEGHAAVVEEVMNLEHDACEEIRDGLAKPARGLWSKTLDEAEQSAVNLLTTRWLTTAIEALLTPLVEPPKEDLPGGAENRRTLPYDVREVTLDGNRYLISGTVTSGDANESFGLVHLLDVSGVTKRIERSAGEGSISPVVRDGSIRCTRCGYEGDETGGFTAMSSATVTAYVNRQGECVTWKNAEHRDSDGYTELRCEECGMDLGDLTSQDLIHLGGGGRAEMLGERE